MTHSHRADTLLYDQAEEQLAAVEQGLFTTLCKRVHRLRDPCL